MRGLLASSRDLAAGKANLTAEHKVQEDFINGTAMPELFELVHFCNVFKTFKSETCKVKYSCHAKFEPVSAAILKVWQVLLGAKPTIGVDTRGGLEISLAKTLGQLKLG